MNLVSPIFYLPQLLQNLDEQIFLNSTIVEHTFANLFFVYEYGMWKKCAEVEVVHCSN